MDYVNDRLWIPEVDPLFCKNAHPESFELCVKISGYNEDDSPTLLYAVSDVSANGSAGDPVPLVDDQAESILLLQVEPPTSPLLVPHEHI